MLEPLPEAIPHFRDSHDRARLLPAASESAMQGSAPKAVTAMRPEPCFQRLPSGKWKPRKRKLNEKQPDTQFKIWPILVWAACTHVFI